MFCAVLTLTVFSSLVLSPIASADSRVADCIELRNPKSTSSSTLITLTTDVYATCSEVQLGEGSGQRGVYAMPEEESLFNLGSCTGPSVKPLIGTGKLGIAQCSLRIGRNTLPSPRKGSTTTKIRVFFTWDFSEKSIPVSHIAIPASTNNGWGGSPSGGSASGTSTGGTSTGGTSTAAIDSVVNDSDSMATAAANDSTVAALGAADAAERSANIAQNSVDLIAELSENIDIYISELKSQIASLERLISKIKTKMGII
jgi:hypothetical protein